MEAAGWVLSAGATAALSGAGRRCAPVPVPPGDAAELPSSRLCFLQRLELLPTRAGITAGQRSLEGRWQPTAHVKTRFLTPVRCSFVGPCSNALCIRHLDLVLFSAFAKDLDDGTEAPSGLQVAQISKGWVLHQVAVLPSRGRSTGRETAQTGMSCTSAEGSAKACTGGGTAPSSSTGWGSPAAE